MSLTSVTIISPEAANGRNVVALGVTKAFAAAKKTAVFRPAVCRKETFTDVLLEASNSGLSREQSVGVCPKRARTDKEGSRADIVAAYTEAIETAQPEAPAPDSAAPVQPAEQPETQQPAEPANPQPDTQE